MRIVSVVEDLCDECKSQITHEMHSNLKYSCYTQHNPVGGTPITYSGQNMRLKMPSLQMFRARHWTKPQVSITQQLQNSQGSAYSTKSQVLTEPRGHPLGDILNFWSMAVYTHPVATMKSKRSDARTQYTSSRTMERNVHRQLVRTHLSLRAQV